MKRLTPAQQFRLEEAKQTLRGYLVLCGVVLFVTVCIVYGATDGRKEQAEWERLPVQTTVARVVRMHVYASDDGPTSTTLRLVWDTPHGPLSGDAQTDGVAVIGQKYQVEYRRHPSGDVRIMRLAPVSDTD